MLGNFFILFAVSTFCIGLANLFVLYLSKSFISMICLLFMKVFAFNIKCLFVSTNLFYEFAHLFISKYIFKAKKKYPGAKYEHFARDKRKLYRNGDIDKLSAQKCFRKLKNGSLELEDRQPS